MYAFAAHIDRPEVLAHKHVSLGITPPLYTIVGRHLLAAVGEVLGDVVTPKITAAWDEVYWLMTTELVARDARLFQTRKWQAGQDWPQLAVVDKQAVSADAVAITLRPEGDAPLPAFRPGQYLSVAVPMPEAGLTQVRQYSFSDAPGSDAWRITVKRAGSIGASPAGVVSARLHDTIEVGDTLRVGPPAGDFHLHEGDTR